jgi:hypothetical protein
VLRSRSVALALVAASALAGCGGGASPQHLNGWRVVYTVEDLAGATPRVTTQVVEVLPPYGARSVTYEGATVGGTSLGGAAWVRGHQYLVQADGSAHEVAQVPPGFAGPDAHLDVAMATALRLGLVRRGGTATVAGTACTEWVSHDPLDSADLAPPSATSSATSCVDARGRLLRDTWVLSGKVVRVRTAVSLGRPEGEPLRGVPPTPLPGAQLPLLVKDEPAAKLATALNIAVPAGPAGLRADGATALLERDLAGGTGRALREGAAFAWTDGTRLVTLQVQRGLVQPEPAPTGGGPVRLANGLTARLVPVVNGLQVRLLTPAGLSVQATGDLPEDALLAWVGGLHWEPVQGP